jgi:NAD(P)-dependent dehydrogenase (short-subunit alcohol dehydrogenase family)
LDVPQQVAIITGAGGGIGRATAVELSSKGFSNVLVGRSQETLDETAKAARDSLVVVADITRLTDIQRVVDQTVERFGRIDALVNNAGAATVASIEQTTPQIWQEMIETNLSAPFHLCRAVWPTFKRQRSGVIVNVSSVAARDPFEGFAAYGAAKAGLNLLGVSLARQGKSIGLRVHTVAPGAVETSMLRRAFSTDMLPTERALSPQDVARVIAQCVTGDLECTSGEVIWVSKP